LSEPGTLGVRVEKRSNNSASAIVSNVVEGSQAEASGLRRGDVLCFAGSDGQDEIPYEMFLQIARSKDRPIQLEARRFDAKTSAASGGSADAESRKQAMIAAAEAREKKHKSQTKTVKHVTKSTLLRQQQQQQKQQNRAGAEPQTEASRRAAEAAKRGEQDLARELGYNPYEAIKKTAGQARVATATTQHGAITAPSGGNASSSPIPAVAAPRDPAMASDGGGATIDDALYRNDPAYLDFLEGLALVSSATDASASRSGLKIARTLLVNATTKGQQDPAENAEKFRRVRLANPKIHAAIVELEGNLSLVMAAGFELHPDESDPDESLLVFPRGSKGPQWLPVGLKRLEEAQKRLS